MQNLLRWLLRRGSPLPIPNREVKPDCADGTAVMWESMSLPFFMEPFIKDEGFFFIGAAQSLRSCRCLFLFDMYGGQHLVGIVQHSGSIKFSQ